MMDATDWGSFGGARLGREHQPLLALCTVVVPVVPGGSNALVCPTGARRGLIERREGVGKEEPSTRPRGSLALAAPLAGGNRPRNGPGERERARLTEKERTYTTARHCTVLGEPCCAGSLLWALGHYPRPIKEGKNRTTRQQNHNRVRTALGTDQQTGGECDEKRCGMGKPNGEEASGGSDGGGDDDWKKRAWNDETD